ncbi:MAG: VRR-NUC domain-containing protein [Gammaproteobacteria bacterium]|nr:VRR-NUC domain-containing protein [Gammaproteobacteria bacterium]
MQPDLPESYYLDNVLTLFEHVRRVYGDLLETRQLAFLDDFAALSPDASKLCIRLLNRSHDCYRRGKLNYREIGSLEAAIDELAEGGFLEINGDIDRATLISLFTLPELRAFVADADSFEGLGKLRRAEFEEALLESDDSHFFTRLQHGDDLLQLLCRDEYLLCQMLFFGNLNQSMTDFVLNDLGLYQFEDYRIDPEHRPYRSTLEIQQHWLLYQLQNRFESGDASDRTQLREIGRGIPGDIDSLAPGFRKSERLRYEVARQLERIGDLRSADRLYRRCLLPPSRERRARIYDQRGKHRAALDLCERIIAQPLDEQELQFACGFAARLIKRQGFAARESIEQLRITHQPRVIDLELEFSDPAGRDPIEIAVAEFHNTLDPAGRCDYVENSLFNGVLGLLLWDVVFAPLPGAFYNPFQYRPSDFYAHDFASRRRGLLDQTWAGISDNEDIWRLVKKRWRRKQGLMNPFVNWQGLDLDLIELALERIDHAHWRAIFSRVLRDLRNNRAGFPDLVQFPSAGGYCLIEVKGPGDSLQKNQQRWMQYFHEHGIPHQLTRVTWRGN